MVPLSQLSAAEEERIKEQDVLRTVLHEYPAIFTVTELVGILAGDPEDFGERDGFEQAIRNLVAHGLLHRIGALVLSSSAARHFEELWV